MVARRRGHDPLGSLFRAQRQNLVQRAARLEGAGVLQVLTLEVNISAGALAVVGRRIEDGTADMRPYAFRRLQRYAG